MPIICESDEGVARRLAAGFREHGRAVSNLHATADALAAHPDELVVIIGPSIELSGALTFAAARRADRPEVEIVLVRRELDVSTLSEAMRAGIREVIPDRDFPALMDACRRCWEVSRGLRVASRGETAAPVGRNGQVVVVFAAKGGCGKSTVATNLAVLMAASGMASRAAGD